MTADSTEYLSPTRKLLRFFERSRDQWKEKCLAAKQRVKRLQTNVANLEVSRERWKQEAKESRDQIDRLKAELDKLKTGSCPG